MKIEEKTTAVETPSPLPRPPQRNSIDTLNTVAYFALGITCASLFLPWTNYTFISPCTLSSCPAPITEQASMLNLITGSSSNLPANTSTTIASILQHAASLFLMSAWIIAVCFIIATLLFFIQNSGKARTLLTPKQTSTIRLIASIIGVVTTLWTAFNISGINQAEDIHAVPGIGLWGTAAGMIILAAIAAIPLVRSRTT